jgi:hypothetical protein
MSVATQVEGFFDSTSNTTSDVVKDPASDACAIIDSVLNIDYAAGRIAYQSADRTTKYLGARSLI